MGDSTYEKQMSAVVGKLLSDLEQMPFVREMHPFEFDKLRRRSIQSLWEAYLIGRKKGLGENSNGSDLTEHRAVGSEVSG